MIAADSDRAQSCLSENRMTRLIRAGLTIIVLLVAGLLPQAAAQSRDLNWKKAPHPRLYLNPAKIASLKKGLQTSYRDTWPAVQRRADAIAAEPPPTYSEKRDLSGDALWWQMDVAAKLPVVALAYVA